ncbi:MAG TPA: PIN domain-containing protein [Candidatus Tyrphobacter sp.]
MVLDANVLAPGLIGGTSASAEIVRLWRRGIFDVLITGKLVEEVAQTLKVLGAEDQEVIDVAAILCSNPEFIVALQHQRMGCGDPGDDYLFETAFTGGASIIVSRDRSVLSVRASLKIALATKGVRVMSDVDFLDFFRAHLFSPLAYDDHTVCICDITGPIDESPCVICRHGFHWDFPCGLVLEREGEPYECACPTVVELQPF